MQFISYGQSHSTCATNRVIKTQMKNLTLTSGVPSTASVEIGFGCASVLSGDFFFPDFFFFLPLFDTDGSDVGLVTSELEGVSSLAQVSSPGGQGSERAGGDLVSVVMSSDVTVGIWKLNANPESCSVKCASPVSLSGGRFQYEEGVSSFGGGQFSEKKLNVKELSLGFQRRLPRLVWLV